MYVCVCARLVRDTLISSKPESMLTIHPDFDLFLIKVGVVGVGHENVGEGRHRYLRE